MNATHVLPLADRSLNEIVAENPAALPILSGFGLDTCCGGSLPLREAAERHGLALPELLDALGAEA